MMLGNFNIFILTQTFLVVLFQLRKEVFFVLSSVCRQMTGSWKEDMQVDNVQEEVRQSSFQKCPLCISEERLSYNQKYFSLSRSMLTLLHWQVNFQMRSMGFVETAFPFLCLHFPVINQSICFFFNFFCFYCLCLTLLPFSFWEHALTM